MWEILQRKRSGGNFGREPQIVPSVHIKRAFTKEDEDKPNEERVIRGWRIYANRPTLEMMDKPNFVLVMADRKSELHKVAFISYEEENINTRQVKYNKHFTATFHFARDMFTNDWEGTYKPLHPERRDQRRARADERRGGLPRELHAQGGGDPKVTERTWLLNDNKPGFEETSLNDLMTFVSRAEPDMKGRIVPKSRKAWGFVKDAYGAENKTKVPWHMRYFRETGLDDDEIIEEVSRIMLSEGDRPVYPSEPRISIKEVRDALQGIADSKERKPKGWWK